MEGLVFFNYVMGHHVDKQVKYTALNKYPVQYSYKHYTVFLFLVHF